MSGLSLGAISFSSQSLADKVYALLEENIISMEIPSGSVLNEDEIATKLDVSRSPVREALLRLEHAGLIYKKRKSRVVAKITEIMMIENYHFWAMTEAYAAAQACLVATPEQLDRLAELIDAMEGKKGERDQYQQANILFHAALVDPCPFPKLATQHANALNYIRWGSNYTLHMPDDLGNSNHLHREILAAYRDKDTAMLEAKIRSHVDDVAARFKNKYFKMLDKYTEVI